VSATGDGASAALLIAQAGFAELLSMAAKGVAEDPPRADFRRSTVVRPQRVRRDYLAELLPSTDSDDFGDAALRRAVAVDEAGRILTASRIAFERQQGATAARRYADAYARSFEAVLYAREAADALDVAADATDELYSRTQGGPDRWVSAYYQLEYRGRRGIGAHDLPRDVLAHVYLGGLGLRELERLLAQLPSDPRNIVR